MLQTLTVRKNEVVAVSFGPDEILLRNSGKSEFGKEKTLCRLVNGNTLVINEQTAQKFGITIEIQKEGIK